MFPQECRQTVNFNFDLGFVTEIEIEDTQIIVKFTNTVIFESKGDHCSTGQDPVPFAGRLNRTFPGSFLAKVSTVGALLLHLT